MDAPTGDDNVASPTHLEEVDAGEPPAGAAEESGSNKKTNGGGSSKATKHEEGVPSDAELPGGNITYNMGKEHSLVGGKKALKPVMKWKFMTINSDPISWGIKATCCQCLGVLECSHPGCNFLAAPLQPRKKSKSLAGWVPKTSATCPLHPEAEQTHCPCSCSMRIVEEANSWNIRHTGEHCHQVPPMKNREMLVSSQTGFEELAVGHPEAPSLQLRAGDATRPSVSKIGPRSSSTRGVIEGGLKCKPPKLTLLDFCQHPEKGGFVEVCGITSKHGIIALQDKGMTRMVKEAASCLGTDTIEGFLHEPNAPPKKYNMTVTSGYDHLLHRWVPLQISILFGKSAEDYKKHWDYFLPQYECTSWREFKNKFTGNTSDFADAIKKGFCMSLAELAAKVFKVELQEHDMGMFYKCCRVHFARSRTRVSKISSVVHPQRKKQFYKMVSNLLKCTRGKFNCSPSFRRVRFLCIQCCGSMVGIIGKSSISRF